MLPHLRGQTTWRCCASGNASSLAHELRSLPQDRPGQLVSGLGHPRRTDAGRWRHVRHAPESCAPGVSTQSLLWISAVPFPRDSRSPDRAQDRHHWSTRRSFPGSSIRASGRGCPGRPGRPKDSSRSLTGTEFGGRWWWWFGGRGVGPGTPLASAPVGVRMGGWSIPGQRSPPAHAVARLFLIAVAVIAAVVMLMPVLVVVLVLLVLVFALVLLVLVLVVAKKATSEHFRDSHLHSPYSSPGNSSQ
jgi:hypothetical protein